MSDGRVWYEVEVREGVIRGSPSTHRRVLRQRRRVCGSWRPWLAITTLGPSVQVIGSHLIHVGLWRHRCAT